MHRPRLGTHSYRKNLRKHIGETRHCSRILRTWQIHGIPNKTSEETGLMNRLVCPGSPQLRRTVGCQKDERHIRVEGFHAGGKEVCHGGTAGGYAHSGASGCHGPTESGKGHAAFVVMGGHIAPSQGSSQWGAARSGAEKKTIRAELAKAVHERLPPSAVGRKTAHAESTFKTPEILSSSSNHSRSGSDPSTIPAPAKTST